MVHFGFKTSDKDIIDWLENKENKSETLKQAVIYSKTKEMNPDSNPPIEKHMIHDVRLEYD